MSRLPLVISAARLPLVAVSAALLVLPTTARASDGPVSVAPPQTFVPPAETLPPVLFSVLHDDRIGALSVPAGTYALTPFGGLSGALATQRFARFLQDYDARLPAPWTLDPATATFTAHGAGFRVAWVAPPTPTLTGTRCAGVFVVEHDDRIGGVPFPAGAYVVASVRGTCRSNMNAFRRLLARRDGRLPAPWRLDPRTGTFSTAAGARFRVKPVS
jgi:hypothetical protein